MSCLSSRPDSLLVVRNTGRIAHTGAKPAVHYQGVTCDEQRIIGREEQHALRDFDWLRHPAEWMEAMHGFANCLGMAEGARNEWSVNDFRTYTVHPHAGGGEFEREQSPMAPATDLRVAPAIPVNPSKNP